MNFIRWSQIIRRGRGIDNQISGRIWWSQSPFTTSLRVQEIEEEWKEEASVNNQSIEVSGYAKGHVRRPGAEMLSDVKRMAYG